MSATRFDNFTPGFACAIVVTSSANRAESWREPVELESSGGDCGAPVLVQGSRPSAGPGNQVVVAWYSSGTDGPFQGSFKIRTAFSNSGTHWRRPMTAENGFTIVDPETGEEIFLPDVSTSAEDGDIRYIRSSGKPYASWSAPVTLNDDGLVRAQGLSGPGDFPDGHGKTTLHVLWEDHRRSPQGPTDPDRFGESSNLYYDIFTTSRRPGGGWTPNTRDRQAIDRRLHLHR